MEGKYFSELCHCIVASSSAKLKYRVFFLFEGMNKKKRKACSNCYQKYATPVGTEVPVGAIPPHIAGSTEFYLLSVAYPVTIDELMKQHLSLDIEFYLADAKDLITNADGEVIVKEAFKIDQKINAKKNWINAEKNGSDLTRSEPLFLGEYVSFSESQETVKLSRGDIVHLAGDFLGLSRDEIFAAAIKQSLASRIHIFDVLTARDFGGKNPPDAQSAARWLAPEYFPEHLERPDPEEAAYFLLKWGKVTVTPFADDPYAQIGLFNLEMIPEEEKEEAIGEFIACVEGAHPAYPKGVLRITRHPDKLTVNGEMSILCYDGYVLPAGLHRMAPPNVMSARIPHPETVLTITELKPQLIEAAAAAARRVHEKIAPIKQITVNTAQGTDDKGRLRLYITDIQIGYHTDFDRVITFCDRHEKKLRALYQNFTPQIKNALLFEHTDVTICKLLCEATANLIRGKAEIVAAPRLSSTKIRIYGT